MAQIIYLLAFFVDRFTVGEGTETLRDTKRTKKCGIMPAGPMKEMWLTLGAKAIKRTNRAAHAINRTNKAIQDKQRYKPVK